MYSLYRTWLARDLALARDPLSVPDVVVSVGEGPGQGPAAAYQFPAHRAVLSANSGYFKAALATLEPHCASVSVSGVGAEAFAPLLAFMYTGYLDLSGDNIYSVLLATHYLHMPRALELCWSFLRTRQPPPPPPPPQQQQPQHAPTLVKPIPSRNKLVGGLVGPPWRPPWRSPPHMVLPTAEHSPFRSFGPPASHSAVQAAPLPPLPPASAARTSSPPSSPPAPRPPAALAQCASPDPRTSAPRASPAPLGATHEPAVQPESDDRPDAAESSTEEAEETNQTSRAGEIQQTPLSDTTLQPTSSQSPAKLSVSGKVVIDVACCDGPVRFHRVLNSSYETPGEEVPDHTDENQLHQSVHIPGAVQLRRARLSKLQDAMETNDMNEYTCLYCNHTFKSHYCYQKHARRHINPLTHKQGPAVTSARQPARPLDMNVQYYPCKTCGSKFPSYYFVHKHRKLCHSGDESEGPTNTTSTEPSA